MREAPPAVRRSLAGALETTELRRGLEGAVDRAIARRERLEPPSSALWPIVGLLQTLATAALVFSVAWVILWVLARPPVDVVVVPLLGRVPVPFAALVASLVVGYALARIIGTHAGWLGRRWARRIRGEIAATVEREVADHALAPLDRLETARRQLWRSAGEVRTGCGRSA